ncbi:MAG TPA: DUF5712 family protein [Tenuifilaceae bacterium]|nr:DUF5712 family protein [Tenuifilaceae bacterium]
MPYLKFDKPSGSAGNKNSCSDFISYLTKEDFKDDPTSKEFLFNHTSQLIPDYIAIEAIDGNRKGLGSKDAKFYTGSLNFSEDEILFISNDTAKIKEYSIKVMEQYAENFNREITINDLNWFAKIEQNRYYKGDDSEVIAGTRKQGEVKEGLNTHVHFIVGRKTIDGRKKISPKTNHRDTQKGPIKGGFNRDEFKQQCENIFDEMFGYLRPLEESYEFNKIRKNGSIDEKVDLANTYGDKLVERNKYTSESVKQKEHRIQQLANYICFGNEKKNVKKLNVDALILQERMSGYSGYVYRSLVNLNRAIKQGKIPKEYDLTERVMNFAFYLESKESKSEHVTEYIKPIAIANEPKPEVNIDAHLNFADPVSHPNHEYDPDAIELLRRKKKGKKKTQDKEMSM